MYSIVMMTALTAAPDAPHFNGYFRDLFSGSGSCSGCGGCSGVTRYSCYGCCGSSSYSSSCCGGSVFGLGLGDRVRSWFQPSGCCGCSGSSYSCSGFAYSCSGYSCSGSAYSCFGGPPISYTPVSNGGLSCQGGMPFAAPPPMFDLPPAPGTPGMPFAPGTPGIPYAVPDVAPGMMSGLRPSGGAIGGGVLASNGPTARASVVVRLPADARLFADGRALNLTGAERKFVSPELPSGQEFVYRFKAEYERDGETLSVTKKVPVRAGTTVTVEFVDLTAARPADRSPGTPAASGATKGLIPAVKPVAQEPAKTEPPIKPAAPAPAADVPPLPAGDRATITVKLPPGATLYVDDRKSPSQEPVRSFATPPLPAGREFAYLIRAEVIRNGQPETLTQKVPFRAGERVTVDFTALGR
jgi:uncharacterized protein (TIGR03000 family)